MVIEVNRRRPNRITITEQDQKAYDDKKKEIMNNLEISEARCALLKEETQSLKDSLAENQLKFKDLNQQVPRRIT